MLRHFRLVPSAVTNRAGHRQVAGPGLVVNVRSLPPALDASSHRSRQCTAPSETDGRRCTQISDHPIAFRCPRARRPVELLAAATAPGSIGCNRNIGLLLTVGESVLMLDDDVLCDIWAYDHATSDLTCGGHEDGRTWNFFDDRLSALSSLRRIEGDLLASHASLLGRSVSSLLCNGRPGLTQLTDACTHLTGSLLHGRDQFVRVTFAGLAGDSARYCSHRLMFMTGDVHAVLRSDVAAFTRALATREVQAAVSRPTITHDGPCMSYCMGVDNRAIVPPFSPQGRGEDTVFGALIGQCDRSAVFGYVPLGIVHDSTRPSAYGDDAMPSARETRISEYLAHLAHRMMPQFVAVRPEERLRQFGARLLDVAALPPADFMEMSTDLMLSARASQLNWLDNRLASDSRYHEGWRVEFGRYRDVFLRSATNRAFFVPVECEKQRGYQFAVAHFQQMLREFAQLAIGWHGLRLAAETAKTDGAFQPLRVQLG